MKKFIVIAVLLVNIQTISAQKVLEEKVHFGNVRLPLQPLGEGVEGYSFTVETPYAKNNDDVILNAKKKHEEAVANYPQTVIESEEKHKEAMIEYEKEVEQARENFKLESEQFNALSKLERLAQVDNKPQLKMPNKPVYSKPSMPVYYEPSTAGNIVFDPKVLAGSYLKIEGYKKATTGNIITGHVVLNDFEYNEPELKVEEKSYYNSTTKQTEKKKVQTYLTNYKRPTYLKLEFGGAILFEGIVESSAEYTELVTPKSPIIKTIEKESVENMLLLVNEFVNNNFGFSQIDRTSKVRFVKNKGGEYDDMEEAKEIAIAAYKNFDGGKNKNALEGAIEIWGRMMMESNVEDKKTRVNEKVTTAILLNLIEAQIAVKNVEAAEKHLAALKKLKLNYSEKQSVDTYEDEIIDMKKRVIVNG